MSRISGVIDLNAMAVFNDMGFASILIGTGAGLVMTLLIHASGAATAIIMTMAYNGIVTYEMAAGFILGANVGTTIDAALAGIGVRPAAKRAALVHILFNIIGICWALPLIKPLLALVGVITPGNPLAGNASITTHLAMLHTVFNVLNTLLFLPFVDQFARLVSIIVPEKSEEERGHYVFARIASTITDAPELKIVRAEKEIRDMAGIAAAMYDCFCAVLRSFPDTDDKPAAVGNLVSELKTKEEYADEMRETLSQFLIECTHQNLNIRSERKVSQLLRIIADIEDMTDDCYSVSLLLEKSVRKNYVFKKKEMEALIPYIDQVGEFLDMVQNQLGTPLNLQQLGKAKLMEVNIAASRKKLQKLGRKRIEAGEDLKTELLFIDLVRGIEKLGDNCYRISKAITSGS
jgi:phosphate:Na+ symporter